MHHLSRRALWGLIAIFGCANILVWPYLWLESVYAGKVPLGVVVSDQNLGGETYETALAKLDKVHHQIESRKIIFTTGGQKITGSLSELGYSIESEGMLQSAIYAAAATPLAWRIIRGKVSTPSPYLYTVDNTKLEAFLAQLKTVADRDPRDFSLEFANGRVLAIPAENGIAIADDRLKEAVMSSFRAATPPQTIPVPFDTIAPALASEAQVQDAQAQLEKLMAQPFQIQIDDKSFALDQATIFSWIIYSSTDNRLTITFDEGKVKTQVEAMAKDVAVASAIRKVSAVDGSVLQEGRDGRALVINDAVGKIIARLKQADTVQPLSLETQKIDRRVVNEGPTYELGRYDGKYIEIDLSKQSLTLIDGTNFVADYAVSTGKWSTPTPIGEFQIHNHIPTAWSKRYGLYMDFWMAITPNGLYGIHQLPRWPNGAVEGASHIGRPVSHGCIRLAAGDAETVYNWAENGTKVFIHE